MDYIRSYYEGQLKVFKCVGILNSYTLHLSILNLVFPLPPTLFFHDSYIVYDYSVFLFGLRLLFFTFTCLNTL